MEKEYRFNDQFENWEIKSKKVLDEMNGTLFLTDVNTGEPVEATIIFLYSTLNYSGYYCRGIARIGDDIGTLFVPTLGAYGASCRLYFDPDPALSDPTTYNAKIKGIVRDLDDDCRYSDDTIHTSGPKDSEKMKLFVNQYHAMQRRNHNPDIPYTEHLYGVASVLRTIAENCKEIPEKELNILIQAALGHDLLEDTAIQENMIRWEINEEVLQLIKELTNPNDDAHLDEYMKKLASDSEEARLIKYADLIENTSSFCYSLHEPNIESPIQRAKDFYIPLLTETTEVLAETSFEKYPKTAEALRLTLKVYTNLLLSRIELLESE